MMQLADRPLTRAEMTALPIALITANQSRAGDLTVLAFAQHSRYITGLYALLPDLARHYRGVREDPVRALLVEHQIRRIWSRLVARSRGYFLNARGLQEYAP